MKFRLLFLAALLTFVVALQAQMTSCDMVLYDAFDTNGSLPNEWTEYNTSGDITVVNGALQFSHSATKPSAYRTFTPITEDVTFSFDVSASRTSVNCQINLMSSTGAYLSTFVIGSGAATIKYASAMSNGVPGGFTEATPVVTILKNTFHSLTAHVDFSAQTVDYYAGGMLMAGNVAFLETTSEVAKIDIQSIYMWSDNGFFNFDNIALSTADENRLLLSNELIAAKALLTSAVIGEGEGQYSQEAYNTFATAISAATVIEGNCSASQSDVDQSFATLEAAKTTFLKVSVPLTQKITVNALDTEQKIVMMGGDMERNAGVLQNAPNKNEIIKWLIEDIPFNTYRVKYDKVQEMTEGNLDLNGAYADQILTMQMILAANPDIKFYATMKSDYHGYSQGNRNNLPVFIYDYYYDSSTETYLGTKAFDAVKYADFLADYIEYMEDNRVPISYLSTSKEWTQVMTTARAKETIENLISILASRNVAMPLIIDPGAWSIKQAYNTVNSYVSNDVNKYVYGYSTHNYSSSNITWSDFVAAANNAGKLAIDDESGHGSGGPTNGLYEMPITVAISTYANKCDMYAGGMQGEIIFELWMSNFKYARPIMFSSTENGRRIRSYYIMKKHVENAYDATFVNSSLSNFGDVSSMAFKKDDKMVLWVINESTTTYRDCAVDISNLNLKAGMTIQQTAWDSTSVITGAGNSIITDTDDQFSAYIPARSINCFIIDPHSDINSELLSNETIESPETLVSVYPNPTADLLNIKTSESISSIIVFDINGRQVNNLKYDGNSINMSTLENGIYFVAIKTTNSISNFTIIKN